jgi:ubiquinone biosynthesis protein COQ9
VLLDSNKTKEKILAEFLPIAALEGWNKDALLKAFSGCEIEAKFADLIFENGCLDLAEFYVDFQNKKTAEHLAKIENFHTEKTRQKIRLALYTRFEVEKNNQLALQRLKNFYLNPKNFTSFEIGPKPLMQGLKACYKIADFIWKEIDDQSTDFNFYTKRLTLAKIILRSFAVFIKDDSKDFSKTKSFIDSQIELVMKFEKCKQRAKQVFTEIFLNQNKAPKSAKEFIKNLPFFRLIKF